METRTAAKRKDVEESKAKRKEYKDDVFFFFCICIIRLNTADQDVVLCVSVCVFFFSCARTSFSLQFTTPVKYPPPEDYVGERASLP